MDELRASFLNDLRQLCAAAGDPSLSSLAKLAKVPKSTLHDLLNGKPKSAPNWATVRKVVKACLEAPYTTRGQPPDHELIQRQLGHWQGRLQALAESLRVTQTSATAHDRNRTPVATTTLSTTGSSQAEQIAPEDLVERESELDQLEDFCTSADTAGAYWWWQAEAWSGKSALLASFAMRPPPGVVIVSFFVRAPWSAHNTRSEFLGIVLEQLRVHLGLDALPPERHPAALFHQLLDKLATLCLERGERLVLIVDGLDEDEALRNRYDLDSIAAVLPSRAPAGTRIIVSGRPLPPLPFDVTRGHAMRDPAIVRILAPSPHARAEEVLSVREVLRLRDGDKMGSDLLGLITAAGGGLTIDDLAQLTHTRADTVERYFTTIFARSFREHTNSWSGRTVYVLAHRELQTTAQQVLGGEGLAHYREMLHAWADDYRRRQWPDDTPEYLLQGYGDMLARTDDVARMVTYATDPHRHDRMRATLRSDGAALSELRNAHDHIASQDKIDLPTVARLAVHRDRLEARNTAIPPALPALWIALGHRAHAERLADSFTTRDPRHDPVPRLMATALARTGHIDDALMLARSIKDTQTQQNARASIAEAAAKSSKLDTGADIARSLTSPADQALALVRVA